MDLLEIEVIANHLLRTVEQAKTAPETPDNLVAPDRGNRGREAEDGGADGRARRDVAADEGLPGRAE
jgi:hypothetical protein